MAVAGVLVAGIAIAGHTEATDPAELARCAGVADAVFDEYGHDGETEYLDDTANEAHIFMAIARRLDGGKNSAKLHIERQAARADIVQRLASGADVHTPVQACSDLRQQLDLHGAFVETPGK